MKRGNRAPNEDCKLFGGYHTVWDAHGDGIAIVQRCSSKSTGDLDMTTMIGGHEIIEAATDPTGVGFRLPRASRRPWTEPPGALFALALGAEVADLCEGTRVREGGFLFERVYSNRAAAKNGDPCLPVVTRAWNSVSSPHAWYPVEGGRATIDLTAFSMDRVPEWPVRVFVSNAGNTKTLSFTPALSGGLPGYVPNPEQVQVVDGSAIRLNVAVAGGVPSGAWATLVLLSFVVDEKYEFLPDTDHYRMWPVGVYVP